MTTIYEVLTHKVQVLRSAARVCFENGNKNMEALWAHKAAQLELRILEMPISYASMRAHDYDPAAVLN